MLSNFSSNNKRTEKEVNHFDVHNFDLIISEVSK
jgi:hypothetical protein